MKLGFRLCVIAMLCCMQVLASGCDVANEFSSKQELSVLQGAEFKYRNESNEEDYILIKNAGGSRFNAIGLPMANQSTGYVWIIENPVSIAPDTTLPSGSSFRLSKETFMEIEKKVSPSPEVTKFLGLHAGTSN